MSNLPYRVFWKDSYTKKTGSGLYYAPSAATAESLFHYNAPSMALVTSCELDAEQGERDIACFLAFRAHEGKLKYYETAVKCGLSDAAISHGREVLLKLEGKEQP